MAGTSTEQHVWTLTWSLAFPTILPCKVYYCGDAAPRSTRNRKSSEDSSRATTTAKTTVIPATFSALAYREIFGDLSGDERTAWNDAASVTADAIAESESEPTRVTNDALRSTGDNLGYGEITPTSVMNIIADTKNFLAEKQQQQQRRGEDHHPPNALLHREGGGTVVDLGSGTGRVLFAAALSHRFDRAVGVELVGALHESALKNLDAWNRRTVFWDEDETDDGSATSTTTNPCSRVAPATEFLFFHEDLTTSTNVPTDVDLVIVHATLFDDELMESVQRIGEGFSRGTLFVMVSKPLRTGRATGIRTLTESRQSMTWGSGTIYVQQRA